MQKKPLLFALAGVVLLCGCNKQMEANTQKIDALTQKMFIVQESQSKQLEAIQAELSALATRMDRIQAQYFDQSQDRALFYHTNTLYFLLTIDKKIQSQFQLAEAARDSASTRAYFYHTNTLDTLYFCTSQIADALTAQEKRMSDSLKDETAQLKNLGDELASRKKTAASDQEETLQRMDALATRLAQIERDLAQIKALPGKSNSPSVRP